MARKILIALCVLFVMPVFVITGCDEVQENLTPKSSFIADFSCEYRKMNITGKLSVSGKKLINISLDSPNTVSYKFFTQQNLILIQNGVIITVKKNLRRRTVWTVVIVEAEVHITMDTDLEAISGVCRCAVF